MNKNLLLFAVLLVLNYQCTECLEFPQFSLEKLFQFGKTNWDKASALVRRAVGGVGGVEADDKGGTRLPVLLNSTGNVTKPGSIKQYQSNLNIARETGRIPDKDQEKEILQRIQAATEKIETLLKLFNASDSNKNGNLGSQTPRGTMSVETTSGSTRAPTTVADVQQTTDKPYPGAYMGYNPITNGTHNSNSFGHRRSLIRLRRSLRSRSRHSSESNGRVIKRRRLKLKHKWHPYHKIPKPKYNMMPSRNSYINNSNNSVLKNMNERVDQRGDANVLRVMWSIQKMIHKLGHVLTMDVRKIGNQAVDNTNEERADIRSNSDRISQMQVGLSGSISDIRYNISNLISSQKQLGKSVSVALENMMQVLNQMVGMVTRRDEQIEELGKLKALGIDVTNPESIIEFLRKSSIYRTKSNKTNVEPNNILLPKSSSNVSKEVKIIRSKQPAKVVKVTTEMHKECNNSHECNIVSPIGIVTSTTETPINILNEKKPSNKTMSDDYKENNVSSKPNVSFKNGNNTVETFDKNHTIHKQHMINSAENTFGNITIGNHHRKHEAIQTHHKGHSSETHKNKTTGNTHKQESKNIGNDTVEAQIKEHRAGGRLSKHKTNGAGRSHGNGTSRTHKDMPANGNKMGIKHGLRGKHPKHQHKGTKGRKEHTKHMKTHSNNVKLNSKKKYSNKKHKVLGKHKKKHSKTLVTKAFNNAELQVSTKSPRASTETPKNQVTYNNTTTLPVSMTKVLKNETIPGITTTVPVPVTQTSQNKTILLGTTMKSTTSKLPSTMTGSHSQQGSLGNKSVLPSAVTKSPSGNVTLHSKSVTKPSKIQVTSRNAIQSNSTNTPTSHTETNSGNSSTLAKLLSKPKNALNISTLVQTTHVPTAKRLVNGAEKGKASVNREAGENRKSVKQAAEIKKVPKPSEKKVGLNDQRDESKNVSKTDNIISEKENHRQINTTKSTKHHHLNHSKHTSITRTHGKPHKNFQGKEQHEQKQGGKHVGTSNESREINKHGKSHVDNRGHKHNLESNQTKHVKNNNAGISKFHNSHSILNKFKNIKHTVAAKKKQNIHKPVTVKKGHNINKGINDKIRQHSHKKGLTAKKGNNSHKGIHGNNGHKIHKQIIRTKKQHVHKGLTGIKGQANHKGIPGMKGSNIHSGLNTKTGQHIHKGMVVSKGQNAHKRITTKKGQHIHKGITSKNGKNSNKGKYANMRHNIHNRIYPKKGENMHRGMPAKKGQHIHKTNKNKVQHGKTHHGRKQVHRHAKSLDNILRGLFRKKQRDY